MHARESDGVGVREQNHVRVINAKDKENIFLNQPDFEAGK
jgi:hypothetical protein